MSNRSFNDLVVPLLQPDPERPGSTVDRKDVRRDAIDPRRPTPETGFDLGRRADGHRELEEILDR